MIKKHIILILAALMFAAVSCSDTADEPKVPEVLPEGSYLTLSLSMPYDVGSRSESHPDETALKREWEVRDISLFTYSSNEGLNVPADTIFKEKFYLTENDFTQKGNEITVNVRATKKFTMGDRLLAVLNMGDLTNYDKIGDVRDLYGGSSWTGSSAADYTYFAMSNASNEVPDGVVKADRTVDNGDGSHTYYFSAEMSVERLAARIDLDYSNRSLANDFKDGVLAYPATLADGKGGTVYVSHILPVNVMQKASYVLKHISTGVSDDFSCFDTYTYTGTLNKDDQIPTAYVIEPHTKAKASPQASWYGATAASAIKESSFVDGNSLVALFAQPSLMPEASDALILAYANENTQHESIHDADCLTGLVIKAQFVPSTLYLSADLSEKYTNVARGTTIYRYTPGNTSTTEADVLYFKDEDVALDYAYNHPEENPTVTCYAGGVCYYNLWLRHTVVDEADRPDSITFPMEYGVVRNHIYRVALSFIGIGHETVVIEDPWNVHPEIYVRPWNPRRQPTIIM